MKTDWRDKDTMWDGIKIYHMMQVQLMSKEPRILSVTNDRSLDIFQVSLPHFTRGRVGNIVLLGGELSRKGGRVGWKGERVGGGGGELTVGRVVLIPIRATLNAGSLISLIDNSAVKWLRSYEKSINQLNLALQSYLISVTYVMQLSSHCSELMLSCLRLERYCLEKWKVCITKHMHTLNTASYYKVEKYVTVIIKEPPLSPWHHCHHHGTTVITMTHRYH